MDEIKDINGPLRIIQKGNRHEFKFYAMEEAKNCSFYYDDDKSGYNFF
jgi:hypothetical protein